jgi:glycosyltransferase involved in cell wall biosynthesis
MKLSIIIPVYRTEATLNRCVESVLNQNLDDFEVILVDDGSPDNCPQMCDDWAAKDAHIRVIHKPNGGLSNARNAGLDKAQGDYITFVDSDDYIAANTYAPLLQCMEDADLLEYSIANRLSLPDCTYTDAQKYWLQGQAYRHTYACNKIYKKSLFCNIRYPEDKVFEDVYTLPHLLEAAKTIRTCSQGYYHYCYNPQSITANANGKQLEMLLDAHLNSGMPIDDSYYLYLLNIQIDVWERLGGDIKLPFRNVHHQAFRGTQKLKAITNNILGIKIICIISKFIHQFRQPSRW